jgi:hypothetical protein
VTIDLLVLACGGVLLRRWSGRPGWSRRHVLMAGGAALVVYAVLSFVVDPAGDPPAGARYATNAFLAVAVLTLLTWAYRRQPVTSPTPPRATWISPGRCRPEGRSR